MADKKNSTALATMDTFAIANRYEGIDPELLAELQDEMEDLDPESGITCRQIKVPSGGGIAYEVQGEDEGDADPMKEILGVIVFTHRLSGYWPGSFGSAKDAKDKIPVCSSMDGKNGLNTQTGALEDCEHCHYNAYNSDPRGGKGKACKNMRRIYMMRNGDPNFYLLTVPPTSIKEVNKTLNRILAKGTPYTGLLLTFKLAKATNANGIDYSTVVIEKKGILPPEIAAAAKEMRRQIKDKYKEMTISLDEYTPTTTPTQGRPVDVNPDDAEYAAMMGGDNPFEEAPPHGDGDAPLPFA